MAISVAGSGVATVLLAAVVCFCVIGPGGVLGQTVNKEAVLKNKAKVGPTALRPERLAVSGRPAISTEPHVMWPTAVMGIRPVDHATNGPD